LGARGVGEEGERSLKKAEEGRRRREGGKGKEIRWSICDEGGDHEEDGGGEGKVREGQRANEMEKGVRSSVA
jgi:hypothetical protein